MPSTTTTTPKTYNVILVSSTVPESMPVFQDIAHNYGCACVPAMFRVEIGAVTELTRLGGRMQAAEHLQMRYSRYELEKQEILAKIQIIYEEFAIIDQRIATSSKEELRFLKEKIMPQYGALLDHLSERLQVINTAITKE